MEVQIPRNQEDLYHLHAMGFCELTWLDQVEPESPEISPDSSVARSVSIGLAGRQDAGTPTGPAGGRCP